MNGSRAFNAEWISTFLPTATDSAAAADVVVCVPSIYLQRSAKSFRGSQVQIGAQDVSEFAEGPFTGEISAAMLADVGVQWVIVGHSERRIIFGEMDKHVAAKAKAALEKGIKVIVCVGETLEERKAGRTEEVICRQLQAVIDAVGVEALAAGGAVAYEPVWAIGSGVAS
ncbi:MAG: triose-phosphate isomerase [Duodenibacillus sp.]|nr:triose-phosphate isomerase [Duodenibacillus sp.]